MSEPLTPHAAAAPRLRKYDQLLLLRGCLQLRRHPNPNQARTTRRDKILGEAQCNNALDQRRLSNEEKVRILREERRQRDEEVTLPLTLTVVLTLTLTLTLMRSGGRGPSRRSMLHTRQRRRRRGRGRRR